MTFRLPSQLLAVSVGAIAILGTAVIQVPTAEVLEKRTSSFNGEISVVDSEGQRFMVARSGHGVMLLSSIQTRDPRYLTTDHLRIMALLTSMHPKPQSVYGLGMGGGALARYHLTQYPNSKVESAEIDPVVLDLARKYFQVQNPRHQIDEGDGYQILKNKASKFDVIWLDADTAKSGPKTLIPANHLKDLRERLSPAGILVVNVGEAKKPETLANAGPGYKMGFSHGIMVQSPAPVTTQTIQALQKWLAPSMNTKESVFLPSHLVAVGNSSDLTCTRFWKTYKTWTSRQRVSMSWGSGAQAPEGTCRDL